MPEKYHPESTSHHIVFLGGNPAQIRISQPGYETKTYTLEELNTVLAAPLDECRFDVLYAAYEMLKYYAPLVETEEEFEEAAPEVEEEEESVPMPIFEDEEDYELE